MNYCEVLESYTIIDDPDVIAIESFIYSALESDTSSTTELKKDLKKLAKAKASNDKEAINEAKKDVDESIRELNNDANAEKDAKKKEKLKKAAKIGGIIAGTLATAATIAVAAKKIKEHSIIKALDRFYGDGLRNSLNDQYDGNKEELRSDFIDKMRSDSNVFSERQLKSAIKIANKFIDKL